MSSVIGRGAEGIIVKKGRTVVKTRPCKSYRIKAIDDKIRKLRTRGEARLMIRASSVVSVPKIVSSSEGDSTIVMEFIDGEKISDVLNSLKGSLKVCKMIGESVARLHDNNIVHGDLTTSNLLFSEGKIFFIDFGLSFFSTRVEDKAVDIHLFKQALEAKHFQKFSKLYQSFLSGYKSSVNFQKTLDQLSKVEARGRHRH
jgi:TP53 regulating kinase and related kinases